jgi:hypothetical protein
MSVQQASSRNLLQLVAAASEPVIDGDLAGGSQHVDLKVISRAQEPERYLRAEIQLARRAHVRGKIQWSLGHHRIHTAS